MIESSHRESQFDVIVDDLAGRGWSATADFLSEAVIAALIDEERALLEASKFRPAGIGRGAETAVRPEIRSDRIFWLDPANLSSAATSYWNLIDRLRQKLNETLYLGLGDFEAHFAVYPAGTFYTKHLDQHRGSPDRMISCLLYLNGRWRPEDGGQLRLYDTEGAPAADILPEAGTFVCIRSDTIYHEVLPTERERMSITGWLRRRPSF